MPVCFLELCFLSEPWCAASQQGCIVRHRVRSQFLEGFKMSFYALWIAAKQVGSLRRLFLQHHIRIPVQGGFRPLFQISLH